jgi:hypothetical protein
MPRTHVASTGHKDYLRVLDGIARPRKLMAASTVVTQYSARARSP